MRRRCLLAAAASLGVPGVDAAPGQVLRIAMTASDMPTVTGIPNNGGEGVYPMPEPTTRLAALHSGQVDWIEAPPPDAIP